MLIGSAYFLLHFFVQFMQFPVLDFGLDHSGSQPFNFDSRVLVAPPPPLPHLLVGSEVAVDLHEALHGVGVLVLGVGRAEAEVGWLGQVHQEPGSGERAQVRGWGSGVLGVYDGSIQATPPPPQNTFQGGEMHM